MDNYRTQKEQDIDYVLAIKKLGYDIEYYSGWRRLWKEGEIVGKFSCLHDAYSYAVDRNKES